MTPVEMVIEQGLVLWRNMLHQGPFLSEQMNMFLPKLEPIFAKYGGDSKKFLTGLEIMEAYILLGKAKLYKQHTIAVVSNISHALAHIKFNKIFTWGVECLRTLILLIPIENFEALTPMFDHIWKVLITKTWPTSRDGSNESSCYSMILLFFDLFILNSAYFDALLLKVCGSEVARSQQLDIFLSIVLTKGTSSNIIMNYNQTLLAYCLATLLPAQSHNLERAVQLVTRIVEFLETQSLRNGEKKRKRKWIEPDSCIRYSPVHRIKIELLNRSGAGTTDLKHFTSSQLQKCIELHGLQWQNGFLSLLPPQVANFFRV